MADGESILKQALFDHQTTERILETIFKRQFPDPPSA